MNWADMFDGGTLMAVEVAGTVLLFLACVCTCGVVLLALYFAGKLLQSLQRYAVRQLRTRAFTSIILVGVALSGCGQTYWTAATVSDKFYTPSTTSVGPAFGKNTSIAVTTSDEQYTIFLRFDDGKVIPYQVSRDQWASLEKGQRVKVRWNSVWGINEVVLASEH